MQTAILGPASQPVTEWEGLPYWVRLGLGFLLIGIGASILATQLRAAFPVVDDPASKARRRYLHYLYSPVFGMSFASFAPFFLPGFGADSRWLIGLVASVLWAPVYDYYKKRYESQLGITLPSADDIGKGNPQGGPKP